jgi:hypothetical protein
MLWRDRKRACWAVKTIQVCIVKLPRACTTLSRHRLPDTVYAWDACCNVLTVLCQHYKAVVTLASISAYTNRGVLTLTVVVLDTIRKFAHSRVVLIRVVRLVAIIDRSHRQLYRLSQHMSVGQYRGNAKDLPKQKSWRECGCWRELRLI